jgi:hypothetical protein
MAILIMIIAAVGMIFGLSKQKAGAPWGKPLAVVCALIALLCAVSHIVGGRGPSMTTVIEREMTYQKVSAQKLAMYLADKHAGAKALVVIQPTGGQDRENPLVAGLKEGFGGKIEIVQVLEPEIPEEAKKMFAAEMPPAPEEGGAGGPGAGEEVVPPLEYWFTPALFDKIAEDSKDQADMIITTIGLPQDPASMRFWAMDPRPKLAVVSGSVYKLKKAIKSGAIVGAVTYSPAAVYEDKPPPGDIDKAFDKRFILVTPENVDDVAAKHGDLFVN